MKKYTEKADKYILVGFILFIVLLAFLTSSRASADTYNPCEYMNRNANAEHKLDVGDDPNFTRISQQNNREIIRACQEYEIKVLRTARMDIY